MTLDAVPEPHDGGAAGDPDADERGEHVERQEGGRQALPDARVRRPRGDQDEPDVGGEAEHAGAGDDDVGDGLGAHARTSGIAGILTQVGDDQRDEARSG